MKSLCKKILALSPGTFVFIVLILFYFFLWFVNPGNKIIAVSFLALIGIFFLRFKNLKLSLAISYLASQLIFTGKQYLFEIIPPGVFPRIMYPEGNVLSLNITPQNIMAVLLVFVLIRDIFIRGIKKINFQKIDVLVIFFFLWPVIADWSSSLRPEVSTLFSLQNLLTLVAYIYFKNCFSISSRRSGTDKIIVSILIAVIVSQIALESTAAVQQFVHNSPMVKNIENLVNTDPEFFSNASDDTGFRYRPAGTFPHTNYLGMEMAFRLLVLLPFLFQRERVHLIYPFFAGLIILMLTLSRSAWIGFAGGAIFCLFIIEKIKKIKTPPFFSKNALSVGILAIIIIFTFIVPRAENSLYTFTQGGWSLRQKQIEDTLSLIVQNPIFGVGTGMNILAGLKLSNQSVFATEALSVHNWFLLTAAENGLPTLLFFTIFLFIKLRKIFFSVTSRVVNNLILLRTGIFCGILSLLTVGIFQPFIDPGLMLIFLAILEG